MSETSAWREVANSLKPHPIADLFPMMDGQEYTDLCGSIQTHGLIHPIVLDNDSLIVDGRNRLRACLDQGVEPRYISFGSLNFDGDERDYIAAINLHRRHLTDDQRVQIAALIFKDYREVAAAKRAETQFVDGANQTVKTVPTVPTVPTAVKVAEAAKVSQRQAQKALKVVADAPELAEKVAAGEMKLNDAAKVAEQKNPPKQRAATKSGGHRRKSNTAVEKMDLQLFLIAVAAERLNLGRVDAAVAAKCARNFKSHGLAIVRFADRLAARADQDQSAKPVTVCDVVAGAAKDKPAEATAA